MNIHKIAVLLICIGIGLSSAESANAAVSMKTVVLTNEQAPGMPQGVYFAELGRPDINAAGRVAFSAVFGGTGVNPTNDITLWSDRSGTLKHEARKGQQAVGLPMTVSYKSFVTPLLNDAGNLAFEAALSGAGVTFENDEAVFSEGATGVLGLIAREGDHAVGTPAMVVHSGIQRVLYNNDGRVAYSGLIKGPGVDFTNNGCIWSGYPGSVGLVVRENNQAPNLPAGVLLATTSIPEPVLGGDNRMAFFSGLSGVAVNTGNDNAIYSGTASMPIVVVREGEPAPGTPLGVNIGGLTKPTMNDIGAISFLALLSGAVDSSNNLAIFSDGRTGQLELVARMGDAGPAEAAGAVFAYFNVPLLSSDGSSAFTALLDGTGIDDTNDECICSDSGGSLGFVAREGDPAPGTPEGVVFAGDAITMDAAFTGQMAMNAKGQVLLNARVDGPGVDDTNRMGIWQHDPVAGLRLIVRDGDEIEVAPGDSRDIQSVIFVAGSGGSDGRQSALNDIGQFAFWALFTDGSEGIFVTKDTDGDGTVDAFDNCLNTVNVNQEDTDGDGAGDACENCPGDADKINPGACGCGTSDDDSDGDGTPDCFDDCPNDTNKTSAGVCGCGTADVDTDGDLILDCNDNDPANPNPGQTDNDGDGVGDMPPGADQCCGGGMPAMMPLMLLGWRRRKRRQPDRCPMQETKTTR